MVYQTTDPTTGKIEKEFPSVSYNDAVKEIEKLRKNFEKWKNTPVSKRLEFIKKVHDHLLENKKKYAEPIVKEIGRPVKDVLDEIDKCASLCKYYLENAENILKDEEIKTEYYKSYVRLEPLGVVLGIMPWNYPYWQAFRSVIPALIAGNLYVMKHASNVPQSALVIEDVMKKSGLGDYFKLLFIDSKDVDKLIETDLIQGVSITGSTAVGRKIGETAGRNLKKVVLELGGSDAFIVLEDANIKKAVADAVSSRYLNSGQNCNSAKRFIVVRDVAEEFEREFVEQVKKLKIGDPNEEGINMGPLASKSMLDNAEEQVNDAVSKGAKVLYGGNKMGKGYYFMPTVLSNVNSDMLVYKEETFCPVAAIIIVKDEEEAVRVANSSQYGLGVSIWTNDLKKGEEITKRIEVGNAYVNKKVRSDPRMPYGGIKNSGLGRELNGYGLKEFVNVKSVIIEKSK